MSQGNGIKPPASKRTGGNDDDDDLTPEVVVPGAADGGPTSETRKGFVTGDAFAFSPASLVGSWFHRLENDVIVWQGVVVAEPQPGVYLAQIDTLGPGTKDVQRLLTMERLTADEDGYDWRFYDTEVEARSAFAMWVATERQRV